MTNKEAIRRIKEHMIVHKMNEPHAILITEALNMAIKALEEQVSNSEKPNKWIPLIKRPMTEEEREEYEGMTGITETMILNCPLPEDGEEVLVSYGDYVCIDTFHDDDGCYFEDVEIDDVEAWMPLPAPFNPQESEE